MATLDARADVICTLSSAEVSEAFHVVLTQLLLSDLKLPAIEGLYWLSPAVSDC